MMTTLIAAAVLYGYFLGPWLIGPFTDLKSCEQARSYQLRHGVNQVTKCDTLTFERATGKLTGGAPLTPEEMGRR